MILYLDTSALVKRYFDEPYTEAVISHWKNASEIVTSTVAYAEAMAAFYRKKREIGIEDALIGRIMADLRLDWQSFVRIPVNDELNEYVERAIERHPLRGFDAIHLASAMIIYETFPADLHFACFDENLSRAARSEGFQTFPEV